MREYQGDFQGQGLKIAIVVSRFNELITKSLLNGALDSLRRHGVDDKHISVAWVPGSMEIPLVAKTFASTKKYDAVICLGAVIRGATSHFDHVAGQSAGGVARTSLDTGVPVIYGILTTETIEQCWERAGTKAGNLGFNWAQAAIETANVLKAIKNEK